MKSFLWRKIIHFSSIIFPLLILTLEKKYYLPIFSFILGGFLTADYLRLEIRSFKILFRKFFGKMIKTEEEDFFTGATWVSVSSFLVSLLFPKNISLISLLFLTVSDNFASIIGKFLGKRKIFKGKTLEGSITFFLISFSLTLFFNELSIAKKLLISLFATLIELLSFNIDDNLTVPLLTAILLYFII
ncbi:MAG: hypothetical protein ABDH49_07320 [Candidatus Hydrothermales bacterium]